MHPHQISAKSGNALLSLLIFQQIFFQPVFRARLQPEVIIYFIWLKHFSVGWQIRFAFHACECSKLFISVDLSISIQLQTSVPYTTRYHKLICNRFVCYFSNLCYRGDSTRRWSLRRYRSFKVIDVGTNRKPVCGFILVNDTNFYPTWHLAIAFWWSLSLDMWFHKVFFTELTTINYSQSGPHSRTEETKLKTSPGPKRINWLGHKWSSTSTSVLINSVFKPVEVRGSSLESGFRLVKLSYRRDRYSRSFKVIGGKPV